MANKFEQVLSDDDLTWMGNATATGNWVGFGRKVEQSVLAKLAAEQEPVAWAASAALQQDYYLNYGCPTEVFASKEALLNEYDKSEAVPLYAHPFPSSWKPIETAPLNEVVMFCDNSMPSEPIYYTGVRRHSRQCVDVTETVAFLATHWQPLPCPPLGDAQ